MSLVIACLLQRNKAFYCVYMPWSVGKLVRFSAQVLWEMTVTDDCDFIQDPVNLGSPRSSLQEGPFSQLGLIRSRNFAKWYKNESFLSTI